jgi:anti-sigma regulatory factor (Ser/Thr protein kinase)
MKIFLKTNKIIQKEFRDFIDQNLDGFNLDIIEDVKIATNEVIQNIYRYGYKNVDGRSIEIHLIVKNEVLVLDIYDQADPCTPEDFINKEYTPSESGHMGINIIKKLTHSFKIFPKENGNHTQLIFNLADINHGGIR